MKNKQAIDKSAACCKPSRLAHSIWSAMAGGMLGTVLLPVSVMAQTVEPAESAVDSAEIKQLDEVVVTAQKRSEPLHEVPLSISVIDASKMADQGQVQLADYFAKVPGLTLNARGAGRTQLILRGISTGTGGNPTVGVTIDDTPFGASSSRGGGDFMVPDLDPADLQHIEVLRGPQGTLYGASSMGGLIKYVTVAPDTDSFSGHVQADVSSTEHGGTGYGVRASANLPVIDDKFALRVSAFKREDAGYIDDPLQGKRDVNDGEVKGGRVAGLWNISDKVTLRFSALSQDSSSGATPNEDVTFDYTPLDGEYTHQRLPGTDGFEGKLRFYDATLNADLGWATFDSITAYNESRHDGPQDVTGTFGALTAIFVGVPNQGVVIDNALKTDKFSQEFRLASPNDDRALQWLFGAFYTKEKSEGFQRLRVVDPVTGVDSGFAYLYEGTTPSEFKEKALFANFTYKFSDRFDVQLGGRYSENDESYASYIDGPLNGGSSSENGSSGEDVFTYSFSPRFKVSESLMTYARVASGYRAGGQNNPLGLSTTPIPDSYDSDSLVSYEVGVKGQFFDNRLSADASLFYIDWTDIQLRQVDQSTGESFYANGGAAKSQGFEASIAWMPLDLLTITGNVAYTDAVLTEDTPEGTAGFRGDRLPYSARKTASLSVVKDFAISGTLDGFVGGGVTYVGDRLAPFNNTATTPRFLMPSYTAFDVRAGIQATNWTLTLYVKNASDEKGYLSATPRNSTTGLSAYGVGVMQPRTTGVSLSVDF